MTIWTDIAQAISATTGSAFHVEQQRSVGGGCINEAYHIEGKGQAYFVKLNQASGLQMFEAEMDGLKEMVAAAAIRVPQPVCAGVTGRQAYLVMEYIPLGGRADAAAMGEQLAAMHRHSKEHYGWHRDNTIGSTPQINAWKDDWVEFYRDQRLAYQLELAGRRGIGRATLKNGEQLLARLDGFFDGYTPGASLLHGDLWGGNAAGDEQGNPVIFDPATYYGDREADLAMTELFGGFGASFQSAYDGAWPIDPGYGVRKTLYNLYHILNHYNLFGGGYGSQAGSMIDRLLSEV